MYKNEVHTILEVGPTYIAVKNMYTGEKFILPTKKLELLDIDPLTIGIKSVPSI